MNSKFKITIPKPCHENWNTMTPKEKGRFCSSCAKNVVDFTKKSATEIQDYLVENKNAQVCGHFYKKQLHSIVIEIPQVTFHQQLSFQKLFILALFFVMGTTLFSCQYKDGQKQKIEKVIIKDSIRINDESKSLAHSVDKKNNTEQESVKKDTITTFYKQTFSTITTTGISICEDILAEEENTFNVEAIDEVEEIIDGDLDIIGEEIIEDENMLVGYIIQKPPRFKESKNLSNQKAKEDFDKRIRNFVQDNFDSSLTECLGLSEGKYRIYTQFTIDEFGDTKDIKVRAPHPKLKKEVVKMLQKLPQFIPGKQREKVIKTKYTLPIVFMVD